MQSKHFFLILFSLFVIQSNAQTNDKFVSYFKTPKDLNKFKTHVKINNDQLIESKKNGTHYFDYTTPDFFGEVHFQDKKAALIQAKFREGYGLIEPIYVISILSEGDSRGIILVPDWEKTKTLYDSLSHIFNLLPYSATQAFNDLFLEKVNGNMAEIKASYLAFHKKYANDAHLFNALKVMKDSDYQTRVRTGEFRYHNSQYYQDVVAPVEEAMNLKVDYVITPSISAYDIKYDIDFSVTTHPSTIQQQQQDFKEAQQLKTEKALAGSQNRNTQSKPTDWDKSQEKNDRIGSFVTHVNVMESVIARLKMYYASSVLVSDIYFLDMNTMKELSNIGTGKKQIYAAKAKVIKGAASYPNYIELDKKFRSSYTQTWRNMKGTMKYNTEEKAMKLFYETEDRLYNGVLAVISLYEEKEKQITALRAKNLKLLQGLKNKLKLTTGIKSTTLD